MPRKKPEAKFIKIPTDFKSLHDLGELVDNYELASRLSEALNGYQRKYVDSYLMTGDEVLRYVPESQHAEYVFAIRNDVRDPNNEWSSAKGVTMLTLLQNSKCFKLKSFMVNTVKKQVDLCGWAIAGELPDFKTGPHGRYGDYNWGNKDLKYNTPTFHIDIKKRMLAMRAHYTFTASQAVGGAWISGGNSSYLSGETYNEYTSSGYDVYSFCTRTNMYTGYVGKVEEPKRPWIKKTSRY